jgi:hypothetical protein
LGLWVDNAGTAELIDDVRLPAEADYALALSWYARFRLEQEQIRARQWTTYAVNVLTNRLHLSMRDSGELLGLSPQRVHQITAAADTPISMAADLGELSSGPFAKAVLARLSGVQVSVASLGSSFAGAISVLSGAPSQYVFLPSAMSSGQVLSGTLYSPESALVAAGTTLQSLTQAAPNVGALRVAQEVRSPSAPLQAAS